MPRQAASAVLGQKGTRRSLSGCFLRYFAAAAIDLGRSLSRACRGKNSQIRWREK